jgi:hypothetical protein
MKILQIRVNLLLSKHLQNQHYVVNQNHLSKDRFIPSVSGFKLYVKFILYFPYVILSDLQLFGLFLIILIIFYNIQYTSIAT